MLRTSVKQCSKTLLARKSAANVVLCEKAASSSSGGGGAGKVLVTLVGGSVLATAGTLAYAKVDPSFRKQVEQTIPMSNQLMDAALGPIVEAPVKRNDPTPASLLQKKLERESKSESHSSPAKPSVTQKLPPPPSPPLEAPVSISKSPVQPVKNANVTTAVKTSSASTQTSAEVKTTDASPREAKTEEPAASVSSSNLETTPEVEGLNPKSRLAPRTHKEPKASKSGSEAPFKLGDLSDLPIELQNRIRAELTEQLKIQFSAYNDYLREQLALQEQELLRIHQMAAEERVLEETMAQQRHLADSISRLQEVERVLSVRQKLDKEEASLKQLWFLCQELNDALKSNPSVGISGGPKKVITENVIPILEDIISDRNTNTLVKLAVESIAAKKDELINNGLYSEDALIERFKQVDCTARRLSLIGSEGGSLWQYILSYTRSLLIVDSAISISKEELADEPVDTSKWDTHEILARVRYYLNHRNLEMSLRYANQLQGAPRKIAADWIKDVRTHLEIRQAANLIQAQAAAVSLTTFGS